MRVHITKTDNQYFGKDFEKLIYKKLSGIELPLSGKTDGFLDILNEDANNICSLIENTIKIDSIDYTGNDTIKETADIKINNEPIEIKYVSNGSGTYFNTSISIFEEYGLKSFREFDFPIRKYLESFFGIKVYKNFSPVNQKESSWFRHNFEPEYEKLKEIDENIRKQYVEYICSYFEIHKDIMCDFCSDMLNKRTKSNGGPDYIFVFNHENLNKFFITKKEVLDKNKNILTKSDLGFKIGDVRFQISWQNGCGLNNPTVRVFLE